jgi:protease IV
MVALVGADADNHSFHAASMVDYLRVMHSDQKLHKGGTANIGVVIASGEILDGRQAPGTIGGESTAELLRQARDDDDLKAVVLRVDSPGGSVYASEQIYREVQALKTAGKTVVVSMGDVAASGGYYISAPADEILASPNTITGSIGVFAGFPTISRTLAKVGVNVDGVGTTALSGAQRIDRPLSPDAASVLQSSVEHTYSEFLGRVAKGRGKTPEQIDAIAQGRVWAGRDALGLGLVDTLGGYDDALRAAARRANLGADYRVRRIEPELTWGQQLALSMRSEYSATVDRVSRGLGLEVAVRQLGVVPQAFDPVARELARWQRMASASHVYAYCFCSPE